MKVSIMRSFISGKKQYLSHISLIALGVLVPASSLAASINLSTNPSTGGTNNDGYVLNANFTLASGTLADAGSATTHLVTMNNATSYVLTVSSGAILNLTDHAGTDTHYVIKSSAGVNTGSTIVNNGTIKTSRAAASVIGITSTIDSITNNTGGLLQSVSGSAIYTNQTITHGIINSGTIESLGGEGIAIHVAASSTVAITNNEGGIITTESTLATIYHTGTIVHSGAIINNGTVSNTSTAETGDAMSFYALGDGLTNTGSIISMATGDASAIRIAAVGAGGIVNNGGTITSYGTNGTILLTSDQGIAGDIHNTGTIENLNDEGAGGAAIDLSVHSNAGDAITINNSGTITGAIKLGNADSFVQTSGGTLSGGGASIIEGSETTDHITNQGGTITNTSRLEIAAIMADINTPATGNTIILSTLLHGLTNTGTIISNSILASSAIRLSSVLGGGIVNTGGTITSYGSLGTIFLDTDNPIVGGIINTGTIQNLATGEIAPGSVGGRLGILVPPRVDLAIAIDLSEQVSAENAITIENSGTITGQIKLGNHDTFTQTAGTSGITKGTVLLGFSGGSGETINIFGGTVTGTIDMGGEGTSVADDGDTIVFGNAATDSITLTNTINFDDMVISAGTINLAGTVTGRDNTSTLTINKGATLIASGTIDYSGAWTVNGELDVPASKSVGGGGNITVGSNGIVKIYVQDATHYGSLTGASFSQAAGGTFQVDASAITTYLDPDTRLHVFVGTAARGTFTPGTVASDNSYIYKFTQETPLIDDGFSIDLNVTRENTLANAGTGNASTAGDALERIRTTGDAPLRTIISTLDSYTSATQISAAIKTLAPTTHISGQTAQPAIAISDAVIHTLEDHIISVADANLTTSMASGSQPSAHGAWGQIFGSTMDQELRKGINGYQATTNGFTLGVDTLIHPQIRIGGAIAYGNSDATGIDNKVKIDAYQGALYGTYDAEKLSYEGLASFTYNNYSTYRTLFDHSVASGDFNGQQYLAKATIGYPIDFDGEKKITPFISGEYAFLKQSSYTETGSHANLHIKSNDLSVFKTGLGTRLTYPLIKENITYIPRLSAAWYYDVAGQETETTAYFTGAPATPFISKGANVPRSSLQLASGFDILTSDMVTVSLDYRWDVKEDFNAHTAVVKARYAF